MLIDIEKNPTFTPHTLHIKIENKEDLRFLRGLSTVVPKDLIDFINDNCGEQLIKEKIVEDFLNFLDNNLPLMEVNEI